VTHKTAIEPGSPGLKSNALPTKPAASIISADGDYRQIFKEMETGFGLQVLNVLWFRNAHDSKADYMYIKHCIYCIIVYLEKHVSQTSTYQSSRCMLSSGQHLHVDLLRLPWQPARKRR